MKLSKYILSENIARKKKSEDKKTGTFYIRKQNCIIRRKKYCILKNIANMDSLLLRYKLPQERGLSEYII